MRTTVPFTVDSSNGVTFPLDETIKGLVTSLAACGCGTCAVEQKRGVGLVTGGGIWLRPALSLRECDNRDGCILPFRARGALRDGAKKDKGESKEDDMWLGKVVNSVDLGGACKKKYAGTSERPSTSRERATMGATGASPSCGSSTSPFESRRAMLTLIFQQNRAPPRHVRWRRRRSGGGAGAGTHPAVAWGNGDFRTCSCLSG